MSRLQVHVSRRRRRTAFDTESRIQLGGRTLGNPSVRYLASERPCPPSYRAAIASLDGPLPSLPFLVSNVDLEYPGWLVIAKKRRPHARPSHGRTQLATNLVSHRRRPGDFTLRPDRHHDLGAPHAGDVPDPGRRHEVRPADYEHRSGRSSEFSTQRRKGAKTEGVTALVPWHLCVRAFLPPLGLSTSPPGEFPYLQTLGALPTLASVPVFSVESLWLCASVVKIRSPSAF